MTEILCRGPGYWTGSHESTPKSERIKQLSGTTMSGERLDGRDRKVGFSKSTPKKKPRKERKMKLLQVYCRESNKEYKTYVVPRNVISIQEGYDSDDPQDPMDYKTMITCIGRGYYGSKESIEELREFLEKEG